MASVRTVVNMAEVHALKRTPMARAGLEDVGEQAVAVAQGLAPRDTGAGAASIHGEISTESNNDYVLKVSWDREHGYMFQQEVGSKHNKPRPHLRPAFSRVYKVRRSGS